jgi:hypothetical protein
MRAFALMRLPEELEAAFSSSPRYGRAQGGIETIRSSMPDGLALRYRGIGRFPFTEYPEVGPGWQGEAPHHDDGEGRARELFLGFLGPHDLVTPWPRAFLSDNSHAGAVRASLLKAHLYEVVELCTPPETPAEPLGFDVGYWGGGNFSILCDTAIWPTWHPPAPSAISELAHHLAPLNRYGLFPTLEAAANFASWYNAQTWAEQEPSDFSIIAVGIGDAV